jgi:5,5'-dehydrodivanillate O-demethylase oxygenase subunit
MIPAAQNQLLTQTGAGTPMGELLRRYWWPIAGVTEFDDIATKPVRLLGEDLVLYKDLGGTFGLVDRHCPHRRADLSYGYVEQCGLRCNYHGWLYDETGRCIAQPYEDMAHPEVDLKARIRIKSYPVEAHAGLLWAYLGPAPAPLVPNWEFFGWKNGFRQIVTAEIPCNWLQCQENSIDPVHFEWMHSNWSVRLGGRSEPYSPTHKKVDFNEFEYGFQYKRIRADTDEFDSMGTIGRICLWPAALYTGEHCEWRVPIDDESTLSVTWHFCRVPLDRDPYVQERIPTWHGPIKDAATGRWISSHVMNQDFIAWVGQGTVADRTKENLGASDRGIALIRRRFLADLEAVRAGQDPKAIVRDRQLNRRIDLPIAKREVLVDGLSREAYMRHPLTKPVVAGYPFQTGQPEEIRRAFLAAIGVNDALAADPAE